jgi:hypothetical protein
MIIANAISSSLLPFLNCTKIGLQSILFTIVWRALSESAYFKAMVEPKYEDDDGTFLFSLSLVMSERGEIK